MLAWICYRLCVMNNNRTGALRWGWVGSSRCGWAGSLRHDWDSVARRGQASVVRYDRVVVASCDLSTPLCRPEGARADIPYYSRNKHTAFSHHNHPTTCQVEPWRIGTIRTNVKCSRAKAYCGKAKLYHDRFKVSHDQYKVYFFKLKRWHLSWRKRYCT